MVGQIARRGGTLVSTLVLARLLDPADFGLFTIAATVMLFLHAANDLGIGFAVVRHRGSIDDVVPTGVTTAVGFSALVYAACFFAAPDIARAFTPSDSEPAAVAVSLIRVLTITLLIDGVITIPGAVLTRQLRERERSLAELVGFAISLVVTFSLAFNGAGAWSLVWGQLTGVAITATILGIISPVGLMPGWSRSQARALVTFGVPLAAAGVLNQALLNTDYVVVNRFLGTAVAGAYFVAFNISNWPVNLISFAMRRVAVAGFAQVQDDIAALRKGFLTSATLLFAGTLPMALLVGLQASDVLAVLYGDRWLAGAVALRFLAAVSVIRLFYQLCSDLLTATGRSATIFAVQLAWLAALIPAMVIGASNWGLAGIGAAHLGSSILVALPLVLWRLAEIAPPYRQLIKDIRRPLLAGLAMAAAIIAVQVSLDTAWIRLLTGTMASATVYALVLLPRWRLLDPLLLARSRPSAAA